MGIQAIKGVEIGDGFETAAPRQRRTTRSTRQRRNRALHQPPVAWKADDQRTAAAGRAAMKPISTVPRALATVDMATGEGRGDPPAFRRARCPPPVVVEAMVALVLARARRCGKFGGDSLAETRRNVENVPAVGGRAQPSSQDPPGVRVTPWRPRPFWSGCPGRASRPSGGGWPRPGLPLLDTDARSSRTGRTIADIFADDGEQEFRRIEEDVVKKALAERRHRVARRRRRHQPRRP